MNKEIERLQEAQETSLSVAKNPRQEIMQIIQNLIEQTQAETDKILENIDEDKTTNSREKATLRCAYWNNGFIEGLKQARGLFSAFQELSLSAPSKEPSLRKRVEVWLGACQQSRKGPKGCFVTTHNEEWFCKDCKKVFDETFTRKVSVEAQK